MSLPFLGLFAPLEHVCVLGGLFALLGLFASMAHVCALGGLFAQLGLFCLLGACWCIGRSFCDKYCFGKEITFSLMIELGYIIIPTSNAFMKR